MNNLDDFNKPTHELSYDELWECLGEMTSNYSEGDREDWAEGGDDYDEQ